MKLKIKVTEANRAKIEAALHEVNGKATRHAFTDFSEVEDVADFAELKLAELKLPKNLRAGAIWSETSGSPVANAYKGNRLGTKITLERISTGWALVSIKQATLHKEGGGVGHLALTRHQYDEAAKRVMAGVTVQASGEPS